MSSGANETTVLVVDDEEEVADLYRIQLQKQYETRVAYGGEEALETIDETVDVVLLDRRMPDLTGDEVLQEIRERGLKCHIVFVSAVDKGDELSVPADDYYEKPMDRDALYEAVESQLNTE